MKLTQMVYRTVVAFKPETQPRMALLALLILMVGIVSLAYVGGTGMAMAVAKSVTATGTHLKL